MAAQIISNMSSEAIANSSFNALPKMVNDFALSCCASSASLTYAAIEAVMIVTHHVPGMFDKVLAVGESAALGLVGIYTGFQAVAEGFGVAKEIKDQAAIKGISADKAMEGFSDIVKLDVGVSVAAVGIAQLATMPPKTAVLFLVAGGVALVGERAYRVRKQHIAQALLPTPAP